VVDRVRFKFFWFAKKWTELDWLTKWSTCDESSRVGSGYPLWQL